MKKSLHALTVPKEIKKDIETVVDTLLDEFSDNIRKIILFGSYAKSVYQSDSDIDFCVVLHELPEPRRRARYKSMFDMEREIDLLFCTQERLIKNELVFKDINEQGVLLYEQL